MMSLLQSSILKITKVGILLFGSSFTCIIWVVCFEVTVIDPLLNG